MQSPLVVTREESAGQPAVGSPSWREIVGAFAALAPFTVAVALTYERHLPNGLTRAATVDVAALAGGALALGFAVASLGALRRTAEGRRLHRVACVLALVALGAVQIARGTRFAERDLHPPSRFEHEPAMGIHVTSDVPGLDRVARRVNEALRPAWSANARRARDAWEAGDHATLAALSGAEPASVAEAHALSVARLGRLETCGHLERLARYEGDRATRLITTCRFARGTGEVSLYESSSGVSIDVFPRDVLAQPEPPEPAVAAVERAAKERLPGAAFVRVRSERALAWPPGERLVETEHTGTYPTHRFWRVVPSDGRWLVFSR